MSDKSAAGKNPEAEKSNVVPFNPSAKMRVGVDPVDPSGDETAVAIIDDEGRVVGRAIMEGQMSYSQIIKAGEDTYLMVDEANWEIARGRFPWKMRARPFSPAMKPRSLGMTTMIAPKAVSSRQYVAIELGEHIFAVPERHTEELCRLFPQNP